MSNYKYNIQGKELELKPVTISQIRVVTAAFMELEIDEATKLPELLDKLLNEKLDEVAEAIFPKSGVKWGDVTYELVDEIVEDFLSLNPRLTNRLRSLSGSLVRDLAGTIQS